MPAETRRTAAAAVLVWAGAGACVAGFAYGRLWLALPWVRFAESVVLAIASLLLAAGVRRWHGGSWASALLLTWLVALAYFAGVLPVLSVAVLAGAALALGSFIAPPAAAGLAVTLAVGLVAIGGVAGWALRWPVHQAWVWWLLCMLACVLRRHALRAMVTQARVHWREAVGAEPCLAAVAMLLLGLATIGTWLPTMQADDLAYHLALPSQLQRHAAYSPDPAQQIWALAPWLGDVLQGIAQVLAGREARGALDALWLVMAAACLWPLARQLGGSARAAWLTLALFGSLPLLASLLAGMQTELPASALLAALALAVLRSRAGSLAMACAALAAGLAALKLSHALIGLFVLAWALARSRGRTDLRRVPAALMLFGLLAGSSYWLAWWVSGNPLLPLFNQVFRSPLLPPEQLHDPRWHAGFVPTLPWTISFDTSCCLEGWDGGFGFALVALAGAWLLALLRPRTRGFALVASGALLLPLLPMQYARYAFPGLVMLLPALVCATEVALGGRRGGHLVLSLCLLNLAFQANSNWLLHVRAVRLLVAGAGDTTEVIRRYAPERALVAELRRHDDGDSIVLALDPRVPAIAELAGRGRSVAHYAPALEAARIEADADRSGVRWHRLVADLGARWLLLRPDRLTDPQRRGLALLDARRVAAAGEAELWSVGAAGAARR